MHSAVRSGAEVRETLVADHSRLDALFGKLLAAFEADDREGVASSWAHFDAELLRHMNVEEQYLIPFLLRESERAGRAILEEHAHLRARLTELGAGVDLHIVRLESARAFVEEIRAHARHEEEALYRWADAHVPEADRRLLLGALIEATLGRGPARTR